MGGMEGQDCNELAVATKRNEGTMRMNKFGSALNKFLYLTTGISTFSEGGFLDIESYITLETMRSLQQTLKPIRWIRYELLAA